MNTLDASLAVYIGRDKYYQESIVELGKRLPPEDEAVAALINNAAQQSDQGQFLFLLYAALASGRKVDAQHLVLGLQFLPQEPDVICVAFRLEGNVAKALTEAVRTVTVAPNRHALGLLVGAMWCQTRQQPVPPELIAQTRILARSHWKHEHVSPYLSAVAIITGDPTLKVLVREMNADVPAENWPKVEEATKTFRDAMFKLAELSILDLVPKAAASPSRILASGTTMRRAVARVGRNDPCPCGSGKKYKRCCAEKDIERLHHSSHVAGKTIEEVEQEPEPHVTVEQIEKMLPFQIARLDPVKIKPDLWPHYFAHLTGLKMFDVAISGYEKLGCPESLFDVWTFSVFWVVYQRDKAALQRLMQLPTYPPLLTNENRKFCVALLLHDDDPAVLLKLLEDKAFSLLDEKDEDALSTLPIWMLRHRKLQWLGVFIARGVIPLVSDSQASMLLKSVIELRDEAHLPPDDPCSDLLDKRLVKERPHDDDDQQATTYRKAQRKLENKAREVAELKETLARLQRDLHLKEKKAKREAASPAPLVSAEETHHLAELRQQLEQVKLTLKQTHAERNEFRRDLEKAHSELEALRGNQAASPATETKDQEETWLLPDEPSGSQPVRLIEFPRKFEETLRNLPRHIARKTMVTLGQIAGGEPAGLAGARRLIECPDITRQRIGTDYRLLFRLLPNSVQVVALINRRDLERTIKTLV